MRELVFTVGLAASVGLDLLLLAGLVRPRLRTWPPPERRSWQFAATWILFAFHFAAFLVIGTLDAGSAGFDRWLTDRGHLIVGAILGVAGLALALWATLWLGVRASSGLEDELVTDGPYRFSRNPAYVGDWLFYLGYTVFWDSRLAAVLGVLGAIWFWLAPRAEEPWLEKQYGESYRLFRERRPRFLLRLGSPDAPGAPLGGAVIGED